MNDNLFEAQYNITKKSKARIFYESYRKLIFASILILSASLISFGLYIDNKDKKKFLLSENYVKAQIYLKNKKNNEALNLLKEIITSNDTTYSSLSLFIVLNENLIKDNKELNILFDHLLNNNKFDKELKNLLIYKKALYISSYVNESKLIEDTKTLIQTESIWRAHALLLLGDFFYSKSEFIKSKEFYNEVLSTKELHESLYNQAKSKLLLIKND